MPQGNIDRLKRVIWRLNEKYPQGATVSYKDVRRAIMFEIGTSIECTRRNIKCLKELGWLKRINRFQFIVTDEEAEI